jgi:hypothetical protein
VLNGIEELEVVRVAMRIFEPVEGNSEVGGEDLSHTVFTLTAHSILI